MQNSNGFVFVLKNIFIYHGNVKTPAHWFSEQNKTLALEEKIKLLDYNKERKQNCWAASRAI